METTRKTDDYCNIALRVPQGLHWDPLYSWLSAAIFCMVSSQRDSRAWRMRMQTEVKEQGEQAELVIRVS